MKQFLHFVYTFLISNSIILYIRSITYYKSSFMTLGMFTYK